MFKILVKPIKVYENQFIIIDNNIFYIKIDSLECSNPFPGLYAKKKKHTKYIFNSSSSQKKIIKKNEFPAEHKFIGPNEG